jgi:hypothetical protein
MSASSIGGGQMVLHHRPFRRRQDDAGQADRDHRAADFRQPGGQWPEPRRSGAGAPSRMCAATSAWSFRTRSCCSTAAPSTTCCCRCRSPACRAVTPSVAPRQRSTRSACWRAKRRGRSPSPAASSSGWPSPAPWSTGRPSCSPTSRPATSTAESGAAILEIFSDFHPVGVTVVVATHDQSWIERYHPNVLRLDHGRLGMNAWLTQHRRRAGRRLPPPVGDAAQHPALAAGDRHCLTLPAFGYVAARQSARSRPQRLRCAADQPVHESSRRARRMSARSKPACVRRPAASGASCRRKRR